MNEKVFICYTAIESKTIKCQAYSSDAAQPMMEPFFGVDVAVEARKKHEGATNR